MTFLKDIVKKSKAKKKINHFENIMSDPKNDGGGQENDDSDNKTHIYMGVAGACFLLLVFFAVFYVSPKREDVVSEPHELHIIGAVKQAQSWHNLSKSTKNNFEACVCAAKACAFLNSVRMSVSDTVIEKVCGVDVELLTNEIEKNFKEKVITIDPELVSFASVQVIK